MRWLVALLLFGCDPIRVPADPILDSQLAPDAAVDAAPVILPCISHAGDLDFGAVPPGERREMDIVLTGCGSQTVAIRQVSPNVDPTDPGFDLPGARGAQGLTIEAATPPNEARVRVVFRPTAAGRSYSATVRLVTDDPERPEIRVQLSGSGSWNDVPCAPWAVRINDGDRALGPGTVITLRADPPPGIAREVTRVTWRVVQRPAGSVANPVEFHDDPEDPGAGGETDDSATPEALFFIDEPGVYTFSATSRLPEASGCADQQAEVRLVACPCPGDLHVQLRWRVDPEDPPPVGIRSNLDLHLAHPDAIVWNDPQNDCRSVNPTPDWGVVGLAADDPFLDNDDADAPGVENIFIDRLERSEQLRGAYRIAVEHVRSEWTAVAEIEVRIGGVVQFSANRKLGPADVWWDVAALGWHEGALTIARLDRTFDTRPPLDATLRPGMECLPAAAPPCSPDQSCVGAAPGEAGRCE